MVKFLTLEELAEIVEKEPQRLGFNKEEAQYKRDEVLRDNGREWITAAPLTCDDEDVSVIITGNTLSNAANEPTGYGRNGIYAPCLVNVLSKIKEHFGINSIMPSAIPVAECYDANGKHHVEGSKVSGFYWFVCTTYYQINREPRTSLMPYFCSAIVLSPGRECSFKKELKPNECIKALSEKHFI